MKCVVCDIAIPKGQASYANAWERTRKRYPCCSPECCSAFNPDIHWLPAVRPVAATAEEENRLLSVTRRRVKDGDAPAVVVREMLLAGVRVAGLRKILLEAASSSERDRKTVRQLNIGGGIMGVLTGWWSFYKSTDKRDPSTLEATLADLDRWEAHFAPGDEPHGDAPAG